MLALFHLVLQHRQHLHDGLHQVTELWPVRGVKLPAVPHHCIPVDVISHYRPLQLLSLHHIISAFSGQKVCSLIFAPGACMTKLLHWKIHDRVCNSLESGVRKYIYLQRVWTEWWLGHPSVLFDVPQDVPVVDLWVRIDSPGHQFPQHHPKGPLEIDLTITTPTTQSLWGLSYILLLGDI